MVTNLSLCLLTLECLRVPYSIDPHCLPHHKDVPLHVKSHFRRFVDDYLIYRPIMTRLDRLLLQKDLNAIIKWDKDSGEDLAFQWGEG